MGRTFFGKEVDTMKRLLLPLFLCLILLAGCTPPAEKAADGTATAKPSAEDRGSPKDAASEIAAVFARLVKAYAGTDGAF